MASGLFGVIIALARYGTLDGRARTPSPVRYALLVIFASFFVVSTATWAVGPTRALTHTPDPYSDLDLLDHTATCSSTLLHAPDIVLIQSNISIASDLSRQAVEGNFTLQYEPRPNYLGHQTSL